MENSFVYVRTNISRWGVASIVLCTAAFAVPPQHPLCIFMPLLQISALTCSVVAAIRGKQVVADTLRDYCYSQCPGNSVRSCRLLTSDTSRCTPRDCKRRAGSI